MMLPTRSIRSAGTSSPHRCSPGGQLGRLRLKRHPTAGLAEFAATAQACRDARRRLAVPEIDARAIAASRDARLERCPEIIRPDEPIGPGRDRDRPLGVVSQRETGNTEITRLFLDAAGVRDCDAAIDHETHETDVRQWFEQSNGAIGTGVEPSHQIELDEPRSGARMQREHER